MVCIARCLPGKDRGSEHAAGGAIDTFVVDVEGALGVVGESVGPGFSVGVGVGVGNGVCRFQHPTTATATATGAATATTTATATATASDGGSH